MSTLVFIEFNKSKISESSAQAATLANELNDEVYGLTSNNDDDYISSLGSKGFDKIFVIDDFNNFSAIEEIIKNNDIKTIFSPSSNTFKELSSKISTNLNFPIASNVLKIEKNGKISCSIFTGKAESHMINDNDSCIYLLNKNFNRMMNIIFCFK